MPAVTDLEGFTYLQREGNGVLLGVYEQNPRHWKVEGADWDFGRELFPEELDRIMPELSIGFARFPVLQEVGIKRWVNGAFTFTPDGNPLVGPVAGSRATGRRAGAWPGSPRAPASGSRVANWIVDGDPGYDVFGMDVARFGAVRRRRRLPARHDRAVLRAALRHRLPERGAPGGPPAEDHAVLRRLRGGRAPASP